MGRWKTINKKVVYQNKFLTIREDEVIDPNGNEGKRNVIKLGSGSVIIIAENKDGGLYLVGQDRYAVDEYSWEFVSGGIKEGESPQEAAQRELAEELDLKADTWKELLAFHPSNSLMDRKAHVFLAQNLKRGDQESSGDEYERINVKTMSTKEIKQKIKVGTMKDALTICSFYSYLQNKKEEEDNEFN
jgi:8-oxo-dGTP pyrophosphatase MutT (NUDIX family)